MSVTMKKGTTCWTLGRGEGFGVVDMSDRMAQAGGEEQEKKCKGLRIEACGDSIGL
jgi:hypothetical protein